MRHQIKTLLAEGMTGILLLTSLTGCTAEAENKAMTLSEPDQQIQEAASSMLAQTSHSSEEGKEETVYVIADASGKPSETIVSTWLKNPQGASSLEDVTDLTDIRNVKGTETFTRTTDGHLTWDAGGNDIYYQGTTDRTLPVSTSISYQLDGKDMKPEELAGRSGHLVIRFDYVNHEKVTEQINGKDVTLYQPFTVVSGLMLDKDKASNVTVTKGKVIDTGNQTIVLGLAMPGLAESLDLAGRKTTDGSPLTVDIPDSVTVEADVTDFKLMTSLTMISNDMMQDLDLSSVNSVDELENAMKELTDASTQLKDGSSALYNGTSDLSEGAGALSEGIHKVDDGALALKDGALALSGGLDSLEAGASRLAEGTTALSSGAQAASEGAGQLGDGLQALNAQTPALCDGAAKAAKGAEALSAGANQVKEGAAALDSGLGTLQSSAANLPAGAAALSQGALKIGQALKSDEGPSLYAGAKQIEAASGAISQGLTAEEGSIQAAADQIAQGAQQLSGGAQQISQAAGTLQGMLGTILEKAETYTEVLSGLGIDVSSYLAQAEAAYAALGQMKDGADAIAAGLTGEGASIYNAAAGISAGAAKLGEGADQIGAGAKSMEDGIDTLVSDENLGALTAGLNTLAESSAALTGGVDQLKTGADALQAGTVQVADGASALKEGNSALSEGASAAADGISQLAEGAESLKDGNDALAEGAAALDTGARSLAEGARSASEGAADLSSGASELKDGTGKLSEGSDELTAGVKELLEGAKELMNGMYTFDEEGIQKLSSLVEDDAKDLVDRVKALQELSTHYTSFDGTEAEDATAGDGSANNGQADKNKNSVRFVIRTESIE